MPRDRCSLGHNSSRRGGLLRCLHWHQTTNIILDEALFSFSYRTDALCAERCLSLEGEPRSGQPLPAAALAVVSSTQRAEQGLPAGNGEALYPWPISALRQQRKLGVHPGGTEAMESAS